MIDDPAELLTEDVIDVLRISGVWRETGMPPDSGAQLDQNECFMEACEFVWKTQDEWKRRKELEALKNG